MTWMSAIIVAIIFFLLGCLTGMASTFVYLERKRSQGERAVLAGEIPPAGGTMPPGVEEIRDLADDASALDVNGMRETLPPAPASMPAVLPPVKTPAPVVQPAAPPPSAVPTSIAAQVDEILQEKLLNSPYAERRVRVTEGAHRGVQIFIDTEQYNEIDDVPDLEIRALIRASAQEWVQRSGKRS